MKRTLYKIEETPECLKWVLTGRSLLRHFSNLKKDDHFDFLKECDEDYNPSYEEDEDRIDDLKRSIKKCFLGYIKSHSELIIRSELAAFKSYKESSFVMLRSLFKQRQKFNKLFSGFPKKLPAKMSRPIVPFYPISKRHGSLVRLTRTKKIVSGGTEVIVGGTLPKATDFKTILALMNLMQENENQLLDDAFICLKTSMQAISKQLRMTKLTNNNRALIINSLTRLNECTLNWFNCEDGDNQLPSMGGIIRKIKKIRNEELIKIYFDMDFFKLYDFGHLDVDEKALFSMTNDQDILLYLYFLGQREFNTNGTLGGIKGRPVSEVWNCANLEGIVDEPKAVAQRRHELRQASRRLVQVGVIDKFKIHNDRYWISRKTRIES